jgi:hypothetical protein
LLLESKPGSERVQEAELKVGETKAPELITPLDGDELAAAAFVALRANKPAPQPAPAAVVAAPLPESFTVVFDSFPSGASVVEGDVKLGTTPMQLSLRNAGLEKEPRKFSIVRDGFLSYAVVQGPSREPVRVLATLALDPNAQKPPEPAHNVPEKRRKTEAPREEPELRTRR